MGKGLRSNRKKAVRTLRRNEVAASKLYQDREAAIQARLAVTLEAGKQARELAEQARAAEAAANPPAGGEGMEVDVAPKKQRGIPLTKKKRMKLAKQRKGKRSKLAVQSLYKRTAKGKKRKAG